MSTQDSDPKRDPLTVSGTDTVAKVLSYIDDHRGDVIATLQTANRTKSVNPAFDPASPGEGAMADLYTGYLKKLGFEVERVEVDGRTNLIATLEGSKPGPKLLFNAHMDTHPANTGSWIDPFTGEPANEWLEDAFSGNIRDGFIYGRGRGGLDLRRQAQAADAAGERGRCAAGGQGPAADEDQRD